MTSSGHKGWLRFAGATRAKKGRALFSALFLLQYFLFLQLRYSSFKTFNFFFLSSHFFL